MNYRLVTVGYDNNLFAWTLLGHTHPNDVAGNRTYQIGMYDTIEEAIDAANSMKKSGAADRMRFLDRHHTS